MLLLVADIPGPTLFELDVGPLISRSVRDVHGGGLLLDLVRLVDRARVGGGFRLVDRARRVLDVDGGRLLDLPAVRWWETFTCCSPDVTIDLVRLDDLSLLWALSICTTGPSCTSLERGRERDLPRRESMGARVTGAESLTFDEERARVTLLERSGPRPRVGLSVEDVDESEETGFVRRFPAGSAFDEVRLLGGRLLFAVGCSMLGGMVLGGANGASELSGFIGFCIQLDTDVASEGGRPLAESPRLGGFDRLRDDLRLLVTIASKPLSPMLSAKATHSELPLF